MSYLYELHSPETKWRKLCFRGIEFWNRTFTGAGIGNSNPVFVAATVRGERQKILDSPDDSRLVSDDKPDTLGMVAFQVGTRVVS